MKKRRRKNQTTSARKIIKREQPPAKKSRWPLLVLLALLLYWPLAFLSTHLPIKEIGPAVGADRFDKLYHFGAYAILSAILTLLLAVRIPDRRRAMLYAIGIAAAYGIFDELTQLLVGRTADIRDWFADLAGAIVGSIIAKRVMLPVMVRPSEPAAK